MVIPTLFCSVNLGRVFDLGELLHDNIVLPDFSLKAPDQITVTLQTGEREKTVSLSTLENSAK